MNPQMPTNLANVLRLALGELMPSLELLLIFGAVTLIARGQPPRRRFSITPSATQLEDS